MTITSNIL